MALGANNPTIAEYKRLLAEVGRATLNSLYPNDFEAYMCSLELVDSKGVIVDFFVFPIMPNSIHQSHASLVNIKKTAGGITSVNTTTFIPIDINLRGNFGRRFKFLVGQRLVNANAINFSTSGGVFSKEGLLAIGTQLKQAVFNSEIKTGYGCIKILEAIYDKSRALDSYGNAYNLFFYNPSLGNNFLVEAVNLDLSQSKEENMIWNYNLQMKAVAPIEAVKQSFKDSLTTYFTYAIIGKGIDTTVRNLKGQLKKLPNSNLSLKKKKL